MDRWFETLRGLFYCWSGTRWAALLLLLAVLGGCAVPTQTTELFKPRVDQSYLSAQEQQPVELNEGVTLRQTFWASHNGLTGVSLPLTTGGGVNEGQLVFRLLDEAGQARHEERLPVSEVADGVPRSFRFPPILDSSQRAYTIELRGDSPAGAGVSALSDGAKRYPGRLTLDGAPLDGDLLAEWSYKTTPGLLAHHAGRGLARYGPTLFIVGLLWTLPGLALLPWLRQNDEQTWSVQRLWATALALSGTLLVIVPQFTHLVGMRLGGWAVWVLIVGSVAALVLARRRGLSFGPVERPDITTALFFALVVLISGSRFLALHPVFTPMWGDSLHHTLITQLLLEHGGIFEDYQPYVPLASFTYHGGFHLLSAWFSWSAPPGSAPLPAASAVLLNGQWLNVLAVVMVGLLAEGLAAWRGRTELAGWAGVLALLFAGLLGPMPAFYLNWGRYTQLGGQVFLPPALLWILEGWRPERAHPRRLVPVILALAALALTHYRVMMMLAVGVPLLLAALLWPARRKARRGSAALLWRLVLTGLVVGLLVLPWYWTIAEGLLVRILATTVTATGAPTGSTSEYNALGDPSLYLPRWLQITAALAVAWLTARRRVVGLLLGGWTLGWFVLSNPYAFLRLPGTGLVNNFTIQIGLYIPAAALAGIGLVDFVGWLRRQMPIPPRPLAALAALAVLALGTRAAWQQTNIAEVSPHTLQTRLDERAAAWVEANTPADAVFHVNGFPAFGGNVVVGSDGGWWLWLSARRATTVPPAIYGHESGFDPQYRVKVNERFLRLREAEHNPEALAAAMQGEGIDYVYVGAQQGRVGLPPETLDPLALEASAAFETVYSDGFVWVFRVRR